MKQSRILTLAIVLLTGFCVISCVSEDIEGNWDPIQVDREHPILLFSAAGGCDTIRLQNYQGWDLLEVEEETKDVADDEYISRTVYRYPDKNGDAKTRNVITSEWYSVQIPEENRKILIVKCNENISSFPRELTISVVVGDVEGKVYVQQWYN